MRLTAAAAILLTLSTPLAAQERPGAGGTSGGPSALQFIQTCAKGAESGTIVDPACTGYLAGFIGAVRIASSVSDDFPICLPEGGLSNNEVVSLVSDYLDQNESYLKRSARSVVFLVLSAKFPCKAS